MIQFDSAQCTLSDDAKLVPSETPCFISDLDDSREFIFFNALTFKRYQKDVISALNLYNLARYASCRESPLLFDFE